MWEKYSQNKNSKYKWFTQTKVLSIKVLCMIPAFKTKELLNTGRSPFVTQQKNFIPG